MASDVGADSECDVRALQSSQLTTAKACVHGDRQQRPVPPPDPCRRIGRGDERSGLFVNEELHRSAVVALGRNRENALAVKRVRRLFEGDVAEERVQCSQSGVAGARRAPAGLLDVVQELRQECSVEILHSKVRGLTSNPLGRIAKEEPKGITVAGDGVRAGAELAE
jgi:hypothetical protein